MADKPKGKVGRPPGPEVTPEQFKQMAQLLSIGLTVTDVCTVVGISRETFYKWRAVGQQSTDRDDPLRKFADAVAAGKASAKAHALGQVTKGMAKDWKAGAWYLGVTYPQEFGPKVRVTLEKEFGDAVSNLEEDFADQPEVLGKILSSLTRQRSPGSDGPPGPEAVDPESGADPSAPGVHSEPE